MNLSDWEDLRRKLREDRPVSWEQMPDFALYMDQVLNYMDRQVIRFEEDDRLTSAMINNYTKNGLVPRAGGKKYGREHLAYLTVICILKRVMPTRDMDLLIRQELRGRRSVKDGYDAFLASLDKALLITAGELERRSEENNNNNNLNPGNINPESEPENLNNNNNLNPGNIDPESEPENLNNNNLNPGNIDPDSKPDEISPENKNQDDSHDSQIPDENQALDLNKKRRYTLADNAIHFALLSYAAGIASNRYVAMLRREVQQYHNEQRKNKTPSKTKSERTKKNPKD